MSYEGFTQHLCEGGHYWVEDAVGTMYDDKTPTCPICEEKSVWENQVNQTNGSHDDEGNRIDGFIDLKAERVISGVCSCCGKGHICETIYKIPKLKRRKT